MGCHLDVGKVLYILPLRVSIAHHPTLLSCLLLLYFHNRL